jgi:hypothetical protein
MEKLNLTIVSEGTLTSLTLTPTLRDQIVEAQKKMWAWIRSGNGSVRMILRCNASIEIVRGFFGLKIG